MLFKLNRCINHRNRLWSYCSESEHVLGTHPRTCHTLISASSSRLANICQALQNTLRALCHGAYFVGETVFAAEPPDSLLDLPQVVAWKRWKQMVLHLIVKPACRRHSMTERTHGSPQRP